MGRETFMSRKLPRVSGDRGSALGAVVILSVAMLIGSLALIELASQDAALAARDTRVAQSLFCAESGVEKAVAWLKAQTTVPTGTVFPFGEDPESFADGLMLVSIDPTPSGDYMIYTIVSLATVDGKSRAIEVDVTPTSFTDFLYFTNRNIGVGTPGYFVTGEVIDGPVFVNDELAILGDPVFHDDVRCAGNTILYYNDGSPTSLTTFSNSPYDEPDFQEGCILGVDVMEWLAQQARTTIGGLAEITLNGNHDVIFGRDTGITTLNGCVSYTKAGKGKWTDVDLNTFNGIIYVNGDCNVSGVVDGQVTVVSNGIMNIVDDLVVADTDGNAPAEGCDDLIGLVAGTRLNVEDNVPNGSDCVIHAHMIAINNAGCLVEQYAQGSPRGALTIYGGIAQDRWGPTGTGYYDEDGVYHVLTGYERDVHYDWRLRTMLPPGYESIVFSGGGFERLSWKEITPVNLEEWEG